MIASFRAYPAQATAIAVAIAADLVTYPAKGLL